MAGYPSYTIEQNTPDSHQVSPGWTVLFVRFKEPTSMYNPGSSDLMATHDLVSGLVENDCVGVDIENSKGDFNKSCVIRLRVTDTVWQDAVSPGDWVFVWASPVQADAQKIASIIKNQSPNTFGNQLCGWDSGLKFVGRVIRVPMPDTTAPNGTRTVSVTITCQAFLEFATSVYYTYVGTQVPNPAANTPSGTTNEQSEIIAEGLRQKVIETRLDRALTNAADKFLQLYKTQRNLTPDTIIAYLFALIMGVPNDALQGSGSNLDAIAGSVSDAIRVPSVVGAILGRPTARFVWEIYSLYLGVQKYDKGDASKPWASFMPKYDSSMLGTNHVFWRSPGNGGRCKGLAPFYPPYWSNETMWQILNSYLNPVVNEMYTVLRVNADNVITPTLVVREQPFSSGLRNYLHNTKVVPLAVKQASDAGGNTSGANAKSTLARQGQQEGTAKPVSDIKVVPAGDSVQQLISEQRSSLTYFYNLPRWVLDKTMVTSAAPATSESDRVNFVQVWGRNGSAEFMGIKLNPQALRQQLIAAGNAVSDDKDIQRNGLRADIRETQFDFFTTETLSGFLSPDWAIMRADWLFNGHLKLAGTIECRGIKEPICEGDNVEYDGIVYHVTGVSHNLSLTNGVRTFTTSLRVNRGVRAVNLNNTDAPLYAFHRGSQRDNVSLPGVSIVQNIPGKEEG